MTKYVLIAAASLLLVGCTAQERAHSDAIDRASQRSAYIPHNMKERLAVQNEEAEEQMESSAGVKEEALFTDGTRVKVSRPFNPRKEVSADAQYIASRIVRTMWTIFVLLPVVVGIIFAIATAR